MVHRFITDVDCKTFFSVVLFKSESDRFGVRYKFEVSNESDKRNKLAKCFFKISLEEATLKKNLQILVDKNYKMTDF